MRPNVMRGGSFAGGTDEEGSAVDALSQASTANTGAMGRLMGRGVADAAQSKAMFTQASRTAFTKAQVSQFLGRGQTLGSAPPAGSRGRDNTDTFSAIGNALREVISPSSRQSSGRSESSGPRTYWKPSGNDGWGDTPLGARGSNESMAAKAIAGFSFL